MNENGTRTIKWTARHEDAALRVFAQMLAAGIPCERNGKPNVSAIILYALQQVTQADKRELEQP